MIAAQELRIDSGVLVTALTTGGTFIRVVVPESNKVLYQNEELQKIFPDALQRPCYHFWGRTSHCEPCLSGEAIKCNARQAATVHTPKGVTFACFAHPFVQQADGTRAALEIFRDITRERALEHAVEKTKLRLLEAQNMATVGNLAGTFVHAVRNPLAGIVLYVDMLLRKVDSNNFDQKTLKESLLRIKDSAAKCEEVTKNLLKLAKSHKVELKPVNLKEVVDQGLHVVSHKNVDVVRTLPDDLPAIMGDFAQLQVVFINLFSNALDAMTSSGTLTVQGVASDSAVEVKVADTGCGISKENLPNLFKDFFSTKGDKGTGLGLTQSRRIIQTHNGNLTVDSEVGKGTTVIIKLPYKK
ncbi:MAG TPA: sensor histidine kinase [Candidatus Tripitaka californicus]|uniref:sensor histidine kinase n=1 Tax=Candidatus Tripitaka californicus TaxID=3367616 RepID=UPI00402A53B0